MENPHIVVTQEMHAPGVTVWTGIWSGAIIGPFFFPEIVTAHSYLEKLRREIVPSITRKMDSTEIFYMQDGAPPHYAQSRFDSFSMKSFLIDGLTGTGQLNGQLDPRV